MIIDLFRAIVDRAELGAIRQRLANLEARHTLLRREKVADYRELRQYAKAVDEASALLGLPPATPARAHAICAAIRTLIRDLDNADRELDAALELLAAPRKRPNV